MHLRSFCKFLADDDELMMLMVMVTLVLLDAVVFARRVLQEITANIGQQNVDELLRQAEQMLTEIRRRDFSQKTHDAQEELARAIEGLCLRAGTAT